MSIWVFLWLVLSIVLLGATFWSTWILIQQKQAWKSYALKNGLRYTSGRFFESPQVEGIVDGYTVSLFSATQMNEDSRKNRQRTVVEVKLNASMVYGLGAGTPEMLPFLKTLDVLSPHDVKGRTGWNNNNALLSVNADVIDAYLTEDRFKALCSVLSIPKADVLVLMEEESAVVRVETANPLEDEKRLEGVLQKLFARIKKLEVSGEELAVLRAASKKAVKTSADQPKEPPTEKEMKPSGENDGDGSDTKAVSDVKDVD